MEMDLSWGVAAQQYEELRWLRRLPAACHADGSFSAVGISMAHFILCLTAPSVLFRVVNEARSNREAKGLTAVVRGACQAVR
eukprot:scaffold647878_cov49-Prasinocladus_malaysianus.AAC.2